MKYDYKWCFIDELYFILRFNGWTFIWVRWLQIHIINKNGYKEKHEIWIQNLENLLSMCEKINLEGSLNVWMKGPLSRFKEASSQRNKRERSDMWHWQLGNLVNLTIEHSTLWDFAKWYLEAGKVNLSK
jgi:hypothetical protein